MTIGFGSGVFHRIDNTVHGRFSREFMNYFKKGGTKAIELYCLNEEMLDYLLTNANSIDLVGVSHASLHTPDLNYADNKILNRVLPKIRKLTKKIKLDNILFHVDEGYSWDSFDKYSDMPISIENMDNKATFGKSVEDIKSILDKYNFGLTLDLQHCFVNDKSMKLALDFQEVFKDKIVEYHISGFGKEFLHHPLFETKQDEIITSIKYKNIPIIIESGFGRLGDQTKELEYIKSRIN